MSPKALKSSQSSGSSSRKSSADASSKYSNSLSENAAARSAAGKVFSTELKAKTGAERDTESLDHTESRSIGYTATTVESGPAAAPKFSQKSPSGANSTTGSTLPPVIADAAAAATKTPPLPIRQMGNMNIGEPTYPVVKTTSVPTPPAIRPDVDISGALTAKDIIHFASQPRSDLYASQSAESPHQQSPVMSSPAYPETTITATTPYRVISTRTYGPLMQNPPLAVAGAVKPLDLPNPLEEDNFETMTQERKENMTRIPCSSHLLAAVPVFDIHTGMWIMEGCEGGTQVWDAKAATPYTEWIQSGRKHSEVSMAEKRISGALFESTAVPDGFQGVNAVVDSSEVPMCIGGIMEGFRRAGSTGKEKRKFCC